MLIVPVAPNYVFDTGEAGELTGKHIEAQTSTDKYDQAQTKAKPSMTR
jgi:hypothetical protein